MKFKELLLLGLAVAPAAYARSPYHAEEAAAGEEALPQESAEEKSANEVLTKYLNAVKAKKWAEAKKFVHPKTIAAIAERKKRLGKEEHPMAPQTYEKTHEYLKAYTVKGIKPAPHGAFVIETSEDIFQVEEKGLAEGEMATYLVGQTGGKFYVVDKRRQETFPDSSVKLSYKGYFDGEAKPAEKTAE